MRGGMPLPSSLTPASIEAANASDGCCPSRTGSSRGRVAWPSGARPGDSASSQRSAWNRS